MYRNTSETPKNVRHERENENDTKIWFELNWILPRLLNLSSPLITIHFVFSFSLIKTINTRINYRTTSNFPVEELQDYFSYFDQRTLCFGLPKNPLQEPTQKGHQRRTISLFSIRQLSIGVSKVTELAHKSYKRDSGDNCKSVVVREWIEEVLSDWALPLHLFQWLNRLLPVREGCF